jgi:hypothetical protein
MPFTFDEMTKAFEEYPANDVDPELVDLAVPGSALNADASATLTRAPSPRQPTPP